MRSALSFRSIARFAVVLVSSAGLVLAAAHTRPVKKPAASARRRITHSSARASVHTKGRQPSRSAHVQSWRAGQSQPTQDRYKEIQEALAKKGYLHGEATGSWDQDSADALRRFQQDQNLEPTGKLTSLSLMALGLGPKHEETGAPPPSAQP